MSGAGIHQDVGVYELVALSHIQEFNRLLALKLEEAKSGELKTVIDAYHEKVYRYKAELTAEALAKGWNKEGYPRCYWFELSEFVKGDWGITILDPWPPPIEPYYELIPEDIVRYLSLNPSFDGFVTLDAYPSTMLAKKLDIMYIWCSPHHIVGIMRENTREWDHMWETGIIPEGADVEFLFRILLRLFYKYPGMDKEFIRDYSAVMPAVYKKHSSNPPGTEEKMW